MDDLQENAMAELEKETSSSEEIIIEKQILDDDSVKTEEIIEEDEFLDEKVTEPKGISLEDDEEIKPEEVTEEIIKIEKPLVNYNLLNILEEMLVFDKEDYKILKYEVGMFIKQNKNKKFIIQALYSEPQQLAFEYVYKIKPILQYIIIRNRSQDMSNRFKRILEIMNSINLDKYVKQLSDNTFEYGKSLLSYKLNKLIEINEKDIKDLVLCFFNAQPIKERQVSQSTLGMGNVEFEEIQEENS